MAVVPAGMVAVRSTQAPFEVPVTPAPVLLPSGPGSLVERFVGTAVQVVPSDVASR